MSVRTERIPEAPGNPYRLGRHVRHDTRSAAFAVAGGPSSTLVSRRWTRRGPVLDQGDLGSCTGNAAAGWILTDNAGRAGLTTDADGVLVDENYAVDLYSLATQLDSYPGTYPPDDTGSDGLSVAQALQKTDWASGYQHAFSLQAALTALSTLGPVMFGTEWLNGMFDPDPDGRLRLSGAVAGGHEYVVDEIDVTNQRVWLCNSWGPTWGVQGRAYLTWADATKLLGQQGDVTVPTPVTAPVPPQPTPPTPTPSGRTPQETALVAAVSAWEASLPAA